ncbi:MAG: transglycosylase domain-containing protein [Candidatus Cryptobacteroides sp.]
MIGLVLAVVQFAKIPSFAELEHPNNNLATQLISSDGEVISTFHIENRTYVDYEDISENVIHAAVATEDARFYKHSGIDFISLGRVFFKTLLMRDSSQGGGSTITQQLAKTLYPREEVLSGFPGAKYVSIVWIKLKEWVTAVKLERNYTKNEIMAMYLNSIFFGSGAYGIKAASETFFAKEPSQLNIQEAAMLVGAVNKPTRYNPSINPEQAKIRRDFVISQMHKAGFISQAQKIEAQESPIELHFSVQDHNSGIAPYFRDMIRREMSASKPKRSDYFFEDEYVADTIRWREDALYGWLNKNRKPDGEKYNLDRDGLRIYVTLDSRMQRYAEEAVQEQLSKNLQPVFARELRERENAPFPDEMEEQVYEKIMYQARRWSERYRIGRKQGLGEKEILAQFNEPARMRVFAWNEKGYIDTTMTPDDSIKYCKSFLRAAFMAIEPVTGEVKAYVGGPDYKYFKFDNIRQGKRQVGSTVKPFLYTLAMQEGMTPCDRVVNMPQTFVVNDGTWTPRSTDRADVLGKTVTLKWGLTHSSNNISAYLMKQFGPTAMARMMRKMGVKSHLDEVYSLCVGPCDLTLCEMVAAFNTFPSQGVHSTPLFVTRIEDSNGNVLATFGNRRTEAISEQTAYLMVNLMEGVIDQGTGRRLRNTYRLKGEIAGKTGTTNDNSDGWFIGYTPKLTAGAWVGGEDRMVHFKELAQGSGSNMALPIWGIFMKKCLADPTLDISETDVFEAPAGMTIDLSCTGGDIELEGDDSLGEDADTDFFN